MTVKELIIELEKHGSQRIVVMNIEYLYIDIDSVELNNNGDVELISK